MNGLEFKMNSRVTLLFLLFCNTLSTGQRFAAPQRYYGGYQRGPSLFQVLSYRGHQTFLNYVTQANLQYIIDGLGPYTILAPTENAFRSMPTDLAAYLRINNDALWQFVASHIIVGSVPSNTLRDGQILLSLIGQQLYVNSVKDTYQSNKTKTWVQGSLIEGANIEASNGIIHAVQKVLITPSRDLKSFLKQSPDHTIISKVLDKSGLRMSAKTTFLAPYDSAFKELPKGYSEYILKNRNIQRKLILHHTFPSPMCQGRLLHRQGNYRLISALGLPVHMYRDPYVKDRLYLDNAELIKSSPVYEGWVQSITGVLLPENRKTVYELSRSLGASTFTRLLDRAGFASWLTTFYQTFTLLVPKEKAFQTLDQKVWTRIQVDKNFLYQVVMYHIIPRRILSENVKNFDHFSTVLKMNNTNLSRPLRVNKFYGKFIVHGAEVIQKDKLAANGIVHLMDKVLIPPVKTLYDLLQQDAGLNIFTQALHRSGFLKHLKGRRTFTVFAPTNSAFLTLIAARRYSLTGSREEFRKLINRHIFPEAFFVSSMLPRTTYVLRTLLKNGKIRLKMKGDKPKDLEVLEYEASGIKTDVNAINGVLHVINKVLM